MLSSDIPSALQPKSCFSFLFLLFMDQPGTELESPILSPFRTAVHTQQSKAHPGLQLSTAWLERPPDPGEDQNHARGGELGRKEGRKMERRK